MHQFDEYLFPEKDLSGREKHEVFHGKINTDKEEKKKPEKGTIKFVRCVSLCSCDKIPFPLKRKKGLVWFWDSWSQSLQSMVS